ncbi:MAG: hypothetical protein KDD38_05680, partial [Bdellovibrionales bacterium]|nr:hypothetical protein [Bdellovibrionales bacterium]
MNKLILFLISIAAVGCAKTETNWLMNPRPEFATFSENAGSIPVDFEPKAEIIFVIDNSASMTKHISNFSNNIDKFVDGFSKNNPLQYNLSVVTVYDTRTYESKRYQEEWATSNSLPELGAFEQVKSSPTEVVADKYFISSSDENLKDLLKNTLKVGVKDLASGGP